MTNDQSMISGCAFIVCHIMFRRQRQDELWRRGGAQKSVVMAGKPIVCEQ